MLITTSKIRNGSASLSTGSISRTVRYCAQRHDEGADHRAAQTVEAADQRRRQAGKPDA